MHKATVSSEDEGTGLAVKASRTFSEVAVSKPIGSFFLQMRDGVQGLVIQLPNVLRG